MAEIKVEIGHGIDGYECPEYENDETELGQSFCQECGEPLEWKEEYNQEKVWNEYQQTHIPSLGSCLVF